MCLSIPGKIKEVCLDYVPEAQVGQFVLIHVGFAISVLNNEEAMARLDVTRQDENFEENLM